MATLDQVRRLRSLNAQQKADYEAKESAHIARISELESQLAAATDPAIQAELDAFETELTPPNPVGGPAPETVEVTAERV